MEAKSKESECTSVSPVYLPAQGFSPDFLKKIEARSQKIRILGRDQRWRCVRF